MIKKKIKKSDKKFKIVVLLASIYCIFGIITTQVEIKEQTRKLNSLQEKCNQKISDNEDCKNLIDKETDDEYIKRIVREKLGFVAPNDRVFMDISAK